MMSNRVAAMGFAPHSGWAAMIVLGSEQSAPRVLARSRIDLIDHRVPESKQPYHAVEGLGADEAARRLDRYMAVAVDLAYSAIHLHAGDLAGRGYQVGTVGILDSAGRKGSSLAAILASHALIHSADGDHFRTALASAAERCRLTVYRVRARDLETQAAACIRRPVIELRDAAKEFGRKLGSPWGVDQKMAALLAWLLLERGAR
jgi:hypothetical protein